MGKGLDEKFVEEESKTRKAIRKTSEYLCFSSEEIKKLRNIYEKIAGTNNARKIFDRMRDSENGLRKIELWKNFQDIIVRNYNDGISYQEFTGMVLGLNEKRWRYFWDSGKTRDILYSKKTILNND